MRITKHYLISIILVISTVALGNTTESEQRYIHGGETGTPEGYSRKYYGFSEAEDIFKFLQRRIKAEDAMDSEGIKHRRIVGKDIFCAEYYNWRVGKISYGCGFGYAEGQISPTKPTILEYRREFSFNYNVLFKTESEALEILIVGDSSNLPAKFKCRGKTCRVMLDSQGSFAEAPPSHNPLAGNSYRFEYNDGQKFDVRFRDKEVTWRGLEGPDRNKEETDNYNWSVIDQGIYLIAWTENDGTFASVVLNLNRSQIRSAGSSPETSWFRHGNLIPLN